MMDDLFDVLLNLVWKYFIGNSYLCVQQGDWPKILFVVGSLSNFGIRIDK